MTSIEFKVVFDQHGAYKQPLIGGVHCAETQITDQQFEMLMNPANLEDLAKKHVKIYRGLPLKMGLLPKIGSLLELWNFLNSTLRYRVRSEQEKGLEDLACEASASCTLISAMHARYAEWLWWGLGSKGRRYVDRNLQMMLRLNGDPMFAKLIMVGVLIHGVDHSSYERLNWPPRKIVLVDDDINFLRAANAIYGLQGYAPITRQQADKYPKLPLLGSSAGRNLYDGIHLESGLPQVYREHFIQNDGQLVVTP